MAFVLALGGGGGGAGCTRGGPGATGGEKRCGGVGSVVVAG